jgi:hypothetical protein
MLPTEVMTLVAVLLFLAPGCVWAVLRRRPKRSTVVRELAAVALVSVVCTGAAIAILAALRTAQPNWVLDYGAWVRTGDYYLHRSYADIATTAALEVVIACTLALVLCAVFAMGRRGERTDADGSVLLGLARRDKTHARPQPGSQPMVVARTHDGTLYQGTFCAIDSTADVEHPVLALGAPIVFQRPGQPRAAMPSAWDRLAVPLGDVAEMWLSSRPSAAQPPTTPPVAPAPPAADQLTMSDARAH